VSAAQPPETLPRGLLIGAAVLLALSLAAAGLGRWLDIGRAAAPEANPFAQATLWFDDLPGGAVAVRASNAGRAFATLAPGTNGFLRSVLRGFVRERRARGVGEAPGFVLTEWSDGRLSLDDPATGRSVDLGAFGPDNARPFVALLAASRANAHTQ
jgi:putative photosynthetic complex assembly protein